MISTMESIDKDVVFVTGETHPELALGISEELGIKLGELALETHPNSEQYVRFMESVRGKHVIIFQPHAAVEGRSVSDSFHQHLEMICAAKLASANEITAIMPHLAGTRQDRKAQGRESVSSALNIRLLAAAGVSRLVAVDLHAPQTASLFYGPFDHLTAQPLLREAMESVVNIDEGNTVVVAPDAGHSKTAAYHARELDIQAVYLNKGRSNQDRTKVSHEQKFDGVSGQVCMLFDDIIDTAGTLTSACWALEGNGAEDIYVAATHGFFSGSAVSRIKGSPINKIFVTDTVPVARAKEALGDQLHVVTVAPMIASAIFEIVTNGSVSKLFDDQNNR